MTTWIIDTENFQGHPVAKMCPENKNHVWGYTHPPLTFKEYNSKNGGKHKQITWKELNEDWLQPYLKNRYQWHHVSTDNFFEMLGCLPPLRHDMIAKYETFFMSEFQSSNETSIYIRNTTTNECYTSIRSIDINEADLEKCILSINK